MNGDALEAEVAECWRDFWAPLVERRARPACSCAGALLDVDQVKRELHDYHAVLREVSIVYCELTGGAISKPNTLAREVIAVHNERCPQSATVEASEREQWSALVDADFALLPSEAVAASVRHLAERLLELTESAAP